MPNEVIAEVAPKHLAALVSARGAIAGDPEESLRVLRAYTTTPTEGGGLGLTPDEAKAALARFLLLSTDLLADDDYTSRLVREGFIDVTDPQRPVYSLLLIVAVAVCPASLRPDFSFEYNAEGIFAALVAMVHAAEVAAAGEQ